MRNLDNEVAYCLWSLLHPFLARFLSCLNIFLSTLFSNSLLSLCFSVLYIYCPSCMQLSLRDLHVMLFLAFLNLVKISAGKTLLLLCAELVSYVLLFCQTIVHFESKERLCRVRALWHWVAHLQCCCNRESLLTVRYELDISIWLSLILLFQDLSLIKG
jgi:hypothetical protein